MEAALHTAARAFGLDISGSKPRRFGSGLIHSTWRIDTDRGPHLLQRINPTVFADPILVVENAAAAAARIDDALHHVGDHDPRHRLVFVLGPEGRPWLRDDAGTVYRASVLVPDSRPPDSSVPEEISAAARAFGRLPGLIAAGSGPVPTGSIPGFHNTPTRLVTFQNAASTDACGRLTACRHETERLLDLALLAHRFSSATLPERLVHGDTKLDNVLVDEDTGEALCVVDLDTVMPGLAAHDFGDLVRAAVTGRPEDEPELDRIVVRKVVFTDLATAYVDGAFAWIDNHERSSLVDGALVITFEQALRFFTDYLVGDVYFPIEDEEHNLRRARAQLRLLDELLAHEDDLRNIVDSV